MGLRINSNLDSFNAHRNLSLTANRLAKSMEKLSSGFRINRAADDAAGLRISERMRGQIRGLAQAQRNAHDGISYANAADGALAEVGSILQRMRELAVQHSNGTNDQAARSAIEREGRALYDEIVSLRDNTTWNGNQIINGAGAVTLQIGANAGNTMTIPTIDVDAAATGINLTTLGNMFPAAAPGTAAQNIGTIDTYINNVSALRGQLGAVTNRLEYTINSLGIAQENMMAAESRIRDVDMAQAMANLSRLQILQESGIAMLAQANMHQSSVLRLLGN